MNPRVRGRHIKCRQGARTITGEPPASGGDTFAEAPEPAKPSVNPRVRGRHKFKVFAADHPDGEPPRAGETQGLNAYRAIKPR